MQKIWLEELRAICLRYPEAEESDGVGDPTFKIRGKIFAMQHPMEGRPSMWCKAQRGFQEMLITSEPQRYFAPPYVGHHGWVGLWLDEATDWGMAADLIDQSYRMTAPKKLIKQLED